MYTPKKVNRRSILRGMLGSVGVTVGLPFLECFLNESGTALASGAPIPPRFGTWFWGMGMNKDVFVPKKVGADYDLPPQIESWKDIKQHVNVFSNYNAVLDGKPNICHFTGWVAVRTAVAPTARGDLSAPSIDVLVADAIGGASRFRSLDCAAAGSVFDTYSFRNADAMNAPDVSTVQFYQKIFGDEFQDPNSSEFTPKPSFMVRKSVLSGVREQAADLKKGLGASDRARLDHYFTSLRELENRLELQMQKPPPAPSCRIPGVIPDIVPPGTDTENVARRHDLMTDLLLLAITCNQTRVFNMVYSNSSTGLTRQGLDQSHHTITHEEATDLELNYQPTSHWFLLKAQESFAYFVKALASMPEGDGTVLDNTLLFAHSDQSLAKIHSVQGIPMMTAGSAGGRLKTGLHIDGNGESPTQVGYTLMRTLGVPISKWGTGSLATSREISEILV